jgi:hypothetical protein
MNMKAIATHPHPAAALAFQSWEKMATRIAMIPHETAPPTPPKMARGRRPTRSMIKETDANSN